MMVDNNQMRFLQKRSSMLWWVLVILSGCTLFTPLVPPSSIPEPTAIFSPLPTPSPTATKVSAPSFLAVNLWVPDFMNPYDETTGAALLNEQLAEFTNINPDIQVQVIVKKASGTGGLYGLLSTAYPVAPSVLPDLIMLNQSDLSAAIEAGYLQPLEPFPVDPTAFFPFSFNGLQKDEQIYGIPFVVQADQMVYRSNVSVTPPLSWTDVLTAGYSLLFPGAPPDGLADDTLLSIYLGSGGTVMDEQGKPKLDRAILEQLYRFFDDMVDRNLLSVDRALALKDAQSCWDIYQQGIGRLSPVPSGLYWATQSRGNSPSWVPTLQGRPSAIAHTWSLALVTTDPFRQEAALELAVWLTAPQQMADLARSTYLLPPRIQALDQWGLLPEETLFMQEWLYAATPALPASIDLPVRRALQSGLQELLTRNLTSPEDAATYALSNLR